jgi:exonuclease SbcC
MWIQRIVARAFGPFHDQTLEFGPGMSVVVGPNEAGKSTWHAAIRLAITGVRRGRGRATAADAAIEARHRPWDAPERWEVEARLALADGRQIDISQDLGSKVACRAVDVALGRDVSDEIMDGTPDASRWLGLDRESFAATVSVSQSQILAVASPESAELLQEHMQRAAATRGTDATAAEAIERLTEFRRQAVGADTAAAKGPLRLARARVATAEAALDDARRRHAAYLEQGASAEAAEHRVAEVRRRLARAEAVAARRLALRTVERLRRAEELAARHPTQPMGLPARAEQADAVAAALDGWQRRPRPVRLEGPTAEELAQRLAALPAAPAGDLRPDPGVIAALRELDLAEERLRDHAQRRPADAGEASTLTPAAVAAILAAAGLALLAFGNPVPGAIGLVVAVVVGAWAWRRTATVRRGALEAAADAAVRTRLATERQEAWELRARELEAGRSSAAGALASALVTRGEVGEPDPRLAADAYLRGCDARAAVAASAAGRDSLERELAARRAAERSAQDAAAAAAAVDASVRDAAASIGAAPQAGIPELLDALRAWQHEQAELARGSQAAIAEWEELRALLGDGTIDDLRADAAARSEHAERLATATPGELPEAGDASEEQLAAIRAELSAAQSAAASLAGGLQVVREALPDVAEAEEALAGAIAELERVAALAGTLDTTLELLRAAEERIHRDLAPILAEAVRRWLPVVSGGAYEEASVDPANLSVRVKEAGSGQWRDAWLLSEGTREQIYLLLRVAMAQHLVRPGEVAPLLLDEVTAQSDGSRKRELLGVLHELSRERQVILFSHDDEVAGWARESLAEPRDRLVRLEDPRRGVGDRGPRDGSSRPEAIAPLPVG